MKFVKTSTCLALSLSMLLGTPYAGMQPVYAQGQQVVDKADFSDTTQQKSLDTLNINAKGIEDISNFHDSPLYDVENNELLLPRIAGYKVEIFGSDNKATISLQGNVTRPLTTQSVKLLYKITNEKDNTSVTTQTNAVVKIPGKEVNVVGNNLKPTVIPEIREWVGGTGSIDVTNARIVLGTTKFQETAKNFQADYQDLTGRTIEIVNGNQSNLLTGDIYIGEAENEAMLGNEGYYLNVGGSDANKDYIEISATHATGALYGTITILQILKQDSGRNELPRGLAKDYPLFEQRGMMLDVARKWIPMSYLKDLVKQMSWYKLNMISLHLSDNDIWNSLSTDGGTQPEGWFRLESEAFPALTSKEHYTKAEFRELQTSSMNLGIDVIPELDTPGHALAYTNAWPDCQLATNHKYLDVTNPKTLENTKKVFDEYIDGYQGGEPTFIGEYVNIGTDEYKVSGSVYKEGFRKYCNDLLEYVNAKGKEAVFWGSLKENSGSTPVSTDATMFAWYQGYADAKQSLDAGYQIISMEDLEVYIVPGGGYYSNQYGRAEFLYNSWLPNNNSGWADRPAPDGHPGVSGGQFAVWNDFHGNGISDQDISYRIQHNLYTIATKCWGGNQSKNDGYSFADVKKLANTLGDAPRADFLYGIDKPVQDSEVLIMDDTISNKVATGTGATIQNNVNVSERVSGKNGNAIAFRGGESYVTTDIKSPGFGWSAAMWIKPDLENPENAILMEGETGKLRLENGKLKYDVENYTHTFDSDIKNGEWTHIALTGTYEGVALYINGVLFDTLIGKAWPNYNVNSGCNSWNGSYPVNEKGERTQRYYETLMLPMETLGSKTNSLKATIDEFHIYNKVLGQDEIKQLAGVVAYENLALHKTVTSSGDETASFASTNVVDGNTTQTRWSSNYSDTAWLVVDLGQKRNVNNIKMYWEAAYAKKYQMMVSEDNTNWTTVYDEQTGKGGVTNITFDMKSNIRYVKFQGEERIPAGDGRKYGFSFYEMEVYGDKQIGEDTKKQNVALDKDVQVGYYNTASTEGDRSGKKAVDGNLETRWEFLHNNTTANFITIPLNKEEDANKIIIKQMVWGGANRISKIRVTAVNGNVETEILPETTYTAGVTDSGSKIDTKEIELGQTVKADAIKIYLTPKAAGVNDLVNIREIEVYGTKEESEGPTEETVIRHHSLIPQSLMSVIATSEHPNVGSEGLASMAIDGNTGTWWHTNYNNAVSLPQSITVDLHNIKTVGKYTYLPRSGAGNGTIKQYTLETSIDGTTYTKVAEGTWEVNNDVKKVEFVPVAARYVRLTALQGVRDVASAAEINMYQSDAGNKDDLQKLVDQIEKMNNSGFIESSKVKLTSAITNAKAVLSGDKITQEELTKASQELQEGLDALDVVGNNVELQETYNQNKDLNTSQYVAHGALDFQKAMEDAKNILDDNIEVGQKIMDAAVKNIKECVENLIDLTDLRAYIQTANAVDVTDATKKSGDELLKQLENAKHVEENKEATLNQVQIAAYRLSVALEDITPDGSALQAIIDQTDEKQYTKQSWSTFLPTLRDAENVLTTTYTMEDLKNARTALVDAKTKLVERADTDTINKVQAIIDAYEKLNANEYTADSWLGYTTLIDQAKELLKDVENVDRVTIQQMLTNLESYVLIPNQDIVDAREKLKDLLNSYDAVENNYTVSSWKVFQQLCDTARTYLTSVDIKEIEKSFNEVVEGAKSLQIRGDTSNLQLVVDKYQLNEDSYTADSYVAFENAMKAAKEAIKDHSDLTQVQIDEIKQNLVEAFNNLKLEQLPETKPEKPAGIDAIKKVQAIIDAYEKSNAKEYTEDSWLGYTKLIDQAKALLKDVANVNSVTIQQMITKLESYVLIPNRDIVNAREKLTDLLHRYDAMENNYTVSSWNVFQQLCDRARTYLTSADIKEIENSFNEVVEGAKSLQIRGDTSHLQFVVDQYQLHKDSYTKDSYAAFVNAMEAAKKAINDHSNLTQIQINEIEQNLIKAFQNLKLEQLPEIKPVEKPAGIDTADTTSMVPMFLTSMLALGVLVFIKKKDDYKVSKKKS
ncbi:MAG: discoidin domain-containing protein [Longicatena sp.]